MTLRRFEDDITGTTDINGNLTVSKVIMTGEWASLKAIAMGSGFPTWELDLNGAPVELGHGPNSPMVLPLLAPGEVVTVVVKGATSNSKVRVHLVGYASDVGIAELPIPAMAGTTALALQAGAPRIQLPGSPLPVITPGSQQAQTFTLPLDTVALRILLGGGGSFTTSLFQVIGQTTQINYALSLSVGGGIPTFTGSSGVITIPVDPEVDSRVQVVITNSGGSINNITAWVSAILSTEATEIFTNPALPIFADITDRAGRLLGHITQDLWMAPTKAVDVNLAALGAGGSSTVLAGVAGQTIRLFAVTLGLDLETATVTVEDTAGLVLWRSTFNPTAAATRARDSIWLGGVPGGVSAGLNVFNRSGGARAIFGTLAVSQG